MKGALQSRLVPSSCTVRGGMASSFETGLGLTYARLAYRGLSDISPLVHYRPYPSSQFYLRTSHFT